jgi:hypothetical protein
MNSALLLFGLFAFLSAFNAGTMTTLQIQHYGIYPLVGRNHFAQYIRANNRAAVVPAILPALLLLVTSTLLVIARPPFMNLGEALFALALNVTQLASTFIWQRRLQAEMAETGYDEAKIRLLLSTNWIRTVGFLLQAVLATMIVLRVLGHLGAVAGSCP